MKKVLVISQELLAPDLFLRLQNEGCDIVIAQEFKDTKGILKGTIRRIPWSEKMDYAKTCDLVICDDNSNAFASQLRKEGIACVGGDKITQKLESNRRFASDTARACGILVPEVVEVKDLEDAKKTIKERGGKWVLKQQKHLDSVKGLNCVAKLDNSEDVISYIEFLQRKWIPEIPQEFVLQEKITGYEMAIGAWFNGTDFMKDKEGDVIVEENFEHKPLTPTGGESTGEMYTVMQYKKGKYSKLYSETLEKVLPLLRSIDFRGDFDINCIINEKGAYFLEYTPRMGVPAVSGQIAIHKSPWYEFLLAVAKGEQLKNFKYDDRYCIIAWLYCKPFPFGGYSKKLEEIYQDKLVDFSKSEQVQELLSFKLSNSHDLEILFKNDMKKEDLNNIHWDGVYWDKGKLRIGNEGGYALTVSGLDDTVEGAGEKVTTVMKKIVLPTGFWRNDFSSSNYHKSKDDLEKWGYLTSREEVQSKEAELKKVKEEKKRKEVREKLKKIVL